MCHACHETVCEDRSVPAEEGFERKWVLPPISQPLRNQAVSTQLGEGRCLHCRGGEYLHGGGGYLYCSRGEVSTLQG